MQAFDLVRQLSASQYLVRALHVVVELGVADVVGEDVTPLADVASGAGADPMRCCEFCVCSPLETSSSWSETRSVTVSRHSC